MMDHPERIYIEVEGTFDDRDAAARCLEEVAGRIRAGDWQAQNPAGANPFITITSSD